MMKNENASTVGIIAEYNPFHNGHAYHIKKAKELAGADCCIVVMSGDFVQRGAPAVYSKHVRAAMALSCGADLVLELPSVFATSSAEDFAACGVALLDRLGVVDSICFGSECGDVDKLSSIASILAAEPPVYTERLKEELKKGAAFPLARSKALVSCGLLKDTDSSILSSPNNILGLEYLKALYRRNSPIRPVTLIREGRGYHDREMDAVSFGSATGIRKALKQEAKTYGLSQAVADNVPPEALRIMETALPVFPEDLDLLLNAVLLRLDREGIPFSTFSDVSKELSARISRQLPDFLTFEDKTAALKTRQYTYTRVSRALLHILLGITDQAVLAGRNAGYAPYARILGFKKSSAHLMSKIKMRGTVPLITKTADASLLLDGAALDMLKQDFYCSHLYGTIVQSKYHIAVKNEYTQPIVIL